MARLSRWLDERELGPAALTAEVAAAYLQDRRAAGYTCWLSPRGVAPLVEYLRSLGVAPAVVAQAPVTPLDELIEDYRSYLVRERGLVAGTVRRYADVARLFLAERAGPEGLDLAGLDAGALMDFVVR